MARREPKNGPFFTVRRIAANGGPKYKLTKQGHYGQRILWAAIHARRYKK